jgi:hypothetical protein
MDRERLMARLLATGRVNRSKGRPADVAGLMRSALDQRGPKAVGGPRAAAGRARPDWHELIAQTGRTATGRRPTG